MHVVRAPDADATLSFLRTELAALRGRRGRLVEVVAACRVEYAGRAASTLDHGERLVVLKPDGTLLVHTGKSSKPVNWMPPGANEFSVAEEDGVVRLTATRRKPHNEVVKIDLLEVHLLLSVPLRDSEELVLRRTEGDLHRLFFERPELLEPGLLFHRGEKDTRRGPVDLWGTDGDGNRVLVEVKRSKAGVQEATQLWRYVEMEREDRHRNGRNGNAAPTRVRGLLVSPGASDGALRMLKDHDLEHKAIDWDDLLAHLEAPRAAGQATLARFDAEDPAPALRTEPTQRTGKRRRA